MGAIVNYELKKFIKRLLDFYPPDNNSKIEIENFAQEYYNTIQNAIMKSKCEYDYDVLMELVKKKYTYKTTPTIPFILDRLPNAEKRKCMPRGNDEWKLLVFILSKTNKETGEIKRRYETYTVRNSDTFYKNSTAKTKEYRECYDDVKVRMFPEGTMVTGSSGLVIRPDKDENEVLIPELA